MAKQRKEKEKAIKLRQPDRSGPSEKTLLQLAEERSLFEQAERREKQLARERHRRKEQDSDEGEDDNDDDDDDDDDEEEEEEEEDDEAPRISPAAERFLEAMLWTTTLAMLHFTFDVLVMNQYATEISWPRICTNAARAWIVFFILFYPLHPHGPNPVLIPGLPQRHQRPARQAVFFAASCLSGCYLIYTTNSKGYLFNMKRAPPLGCLWLWSVVELDLPWAAASLAVAAAFLWQGGYDIK